MGGGDLNMKKSWHPATFQNTERVWKREQEAEKERKKIEELRKEIEDQRKIEDIQRAAEQNGYKQKSDKLDWMYMGAAPRADHEAYLLGKPIDDRVKPPQSDDLKIGAKPGAAFAAPTVDAVRDMERKVRSDPLFAMKKKEHDMVRDIMSNPVRMKQLQKLRTQMMGGDAAAAPAPASSHDDHAPRAAAARRASRSPPRRHRDEPDRSRRAARSPSPRRASRSPRRLSRSPPRRTSRRSRSRSPAARRASRSPPRRRVSRSPPRRSSRSPSRSDRPRGGAPAARAVQGHHGHHGRRRREEEDPAEMERKLAEMMANAKEYETERTERVKRHDVKEAEREARDKAAKPDFIDEFTRESFSLDAAPTVADRIHRNISFVQRTAAGQSSHFTSRD